MSDATRTRKGSLLRRTATHPLPWAIVLGAALLLGLPALHRALARPPLPVLGSVPSFSLVDQDGKPFGKAQMKGHPTVVDFFFTSCRSLCPLLSAKMERLQQRFRGTDVRLLSISVDPRNDTPAVLLGYGARYHRDPSRWTMITGDPGAVERTVVAGFKIELERAGKNAAVPADTVIHGGNLVLVDGAGRIRGYYQAGQDDLARLVQDARRLAAGGDA